MTTRSIAFINEKGGTCKTTLAVNTAAYFATKKEARVLLVDLDTQGHAGKSLGLDVRASAPNVFHWLTRDDVAFSQVARPTSIPGLTVIPSYKEMADFPLVMAGAADKEHRLHKRLALLREFDVVIFDAPPSLGLSTTNILVAATEVVIPVAVTYLSLDGCAEMVETLDQVGRDVRHSELPILRVVATLYRKTALADEIMERLRHHFPSTLSPHSLPMNVAIDEAQSHGKTIWEHAPWSRGATLLQDIAEDLWTARPAHSKAA